MDKGTKKLRDKRTKGQRDNILKDKWTKGPRGKVKRVKRATNN